MGHDYSDVETRHFPKCTQETPEKLRSGDDELEMLWEQVVVACHMLGETENTHLGNQVARLRFKPDKYKLIPDKFKLIPGKFKLIPGKYKLIPDKYELIPDSTS
jgi:hypothetical protein